MIKDEFKIDHSSITQDFKTFRDSTFRRMILESYQETCSVCGIKLITSSGISVIDAAHILPYFKFRNNDVRNGIALCKTHHWLFDKGLISVDPHYRIVVSRSIEEEYPNNIITGYNKKDIILPKNSEIFPSHIAFEWHMENVFH